MLRVLFPVLLTFLSLPTTALAQGKFTADKRVSASVDGTICKSGLFHATRVTIDKATIEIECKRFFKTKGYTRKMHQLDNFSWESGLTRGRLTAKERDGREFYIEVRKAQLPALKAALKGHMDGEGAPAKGKKGR